MKQRHVKFLVISFMSAWAFIFESKVVAKVESCQNTVISSFVNTLKEILYLRGYATDICCPASGFEEVTNGLDGSCSFSRATLKIWK